MSCAGCWRRGNWDEPELSSAAGPGAAPRRDGGRRLRPQPPDGGRGTPGGRPEGRRGLRRPKHLRHGDPGLRRAGGGLRRAGAGVPPGGADAAGIRRRSEPLLPPSAAGAAPAAAALLRPALRQPLAGAQLRGGGDEHLPQLPPGTELRDPPAGGTAGGPGLGVAGGLPAGLRRTGHGGPALPAAAALGGVSRGGPPGPGPLAGGPSRHGPPLGGPAAALPRRPVAPLPPGGAEEICHRPAGAGLYGGGAALPLLP